MLNRILIQNFALIDSLEISLNKGLQVITGETGAGKSIILGALRLILGERADVKSILNTEKKSIVEAEFTLDETLKIQFDENDLDFEKQTIIRREILPSGKSRAFVNDVPVTLDVLKGISEKLIDIHSQFETSNLFTEAFQFRMMDGLAGNKELFKEYQQHYYRLSEIKKELNLLTEKREARNKELDYKLFLLKELEEASLDDLDFDDLQSKLQMQENSESISENLIQILARFDMDEVGILDAMADVRSKFLKTAELSHHFSALNERFENQFLELKDLVFELQNEAEKIEINPQTLAELNSLVNKINSLFLKHNVTTVQELAEIRDQIASEQTHFEELDNHIIQLEKEISEEEALLNKLAASLTKNRKKHVPSYIQKTEALLKKLGLEKAKMDVQFSETQKFTPFGKENVEILFQANSGFPLKPIQSAISGGERSRVMLAVKKIMAENDELPTLILDEIDTGVSGKTANEMGEVMQQMSHDMQLIVITHLAQVAAKGDANYKVIKTEVNGKTQSNIIALNEEEKLQEIAQLLSGSSITEAALKQAKELTR